MNTEEDDDILKFRASEEDPTVLALKEAAHHHGFEAGGGGSESGGGGGGGGSGSTEGGSTATAGETIPVVDASTGEVVGTAHVDSVTGQIETDGTETTVVVESSGATAGSVGAGATEPPATTPPVDVPAREPEPTAGALDPSSFAFHPSTPENEQKTGCVPIGFGAATPVGWVTIVLGVVVTAPRRLRDGRELTPRKAQRDSVSAATATAEFMVDALNIGALGESQVRVQFSKRMDAIMRAQGLGYRVQRCTPG